MTATYKVLEVWKRACERWDPETARHTHRVAQLARSALASLQLTDREQAELIVSAASMHDIGKLGISATVLAKPGQLTTEERRLIEWHAGLGADLLGCCSGFIQVATLVRHHHERWDGKGYPDGLAENEIPFGARLIAVADSFDAMTSHRAYRPAMSAQQAAAILRAGRWRQWDGAIVDAFLYGIEQHPSLERGMLPDGIDRRAA